MSNELVRKKKASVARNNSKRKKICWRIKW
jgi:hypothetical protein